MNKVDRPIINSRQPILIWSSWDREKIVSTLANSVLQKWSKASRIETRWVELDNELNRIHRSSLVLWVSSNTRDAESIAYQVDRYRQTSPSTLHVVSLNPSCQHRASSLVQVGIHAIVGSLERLPDRLQSLITKALLIEQTTQPLFAGVETKLPWGSQEVGSGSTLNP